MLIWKNNCLESYLFLIYGGKILVKSQKYIGRMLPFFQKSTYTFSLILDHDSGNDEPEFLLRGAAAIVDLEKQLSRGDESEQEQENIDDQHALVKLFQK